MPDQDSTPRPPALAGRLPSPRTLRRLTLGVLVGVASVWSASLVVAGLWLAFSARQTWPMFSSAALLGGVTAIAMGVFVFMFLVADRLFPKAGRHVGWIIEVAIVVLICAGLVATAWAVWSGAGP
ncbi:MAG: hypothetical protein AAFX79_04685 [Planctomycetota bacterium]